MLSLFRFLIPLSLVVISSCRVDREAVLPPNNQIQDLPATIEQEITRTPTSQNKKILETAEPTDPPEEEIMDSRANADVLFVRAVKDPQPNSWTFHVTVQHPDTGWEDYADGWDVVLPGGEVLKPDPDAPFTRLLLHPHEAEQPFTRSQSGIIIPEEITTVYVRAHDLKDGYGGEVVELNLAVDSDSTFEVIR